MPTDPIQGEPLALTPPRARRIIGTGPPCARLSVERAAQALVEALQLPACVQVTINLHDGQVESVEPRLKFQRVHSDRRTTPRRPTSQRAAAMMPP